MFRRGFLCAFLLIGCGTAQAQGPTSGSIQGIVRDPNGAVVANASISVDSRSNGQQRKLTTDDSGHWIAVMLPPGTYRITVSATGFAVAVLDGIDVSVNGTTRVDFDLLIAGPSRIVHVESSPQRDGLQLGQTVDSRLVSDLPLATRNFSQILSLSPGVATYLPDSTGVGRNTQTISINGARMTQNNVQINGIDANTMGTSAAVNIAVPAPESIQEFRVQTLFFDSSYGRSGGGNVQIITKSGGNDFHGSVYEYFRNDVLNANNPFLKAANLARPLLRRNVFGTTVGGPLRRDVVYFFLSYQGTREQNGASLLNSISSGVLIADGLTDDRSEKNLLETFKPRLANGNLATAIDPVALSLLNQRLPSGQFLIPTPQTNGRYLGSAISRFREDQFNANIDYRVSQKHWFTLKTFIANAPSYLALPSFRGTGPNVPGFGADQRTDVRMISMQNVQSFGSNIFNEVRAGYNVHRNRTIPAQPVNDSDVGITRSTADAFPGLGLIRIAQSAGGVIIGTQTNIVQATPSVATLADTVTFTKRRQTVRTGTEIRFNEVIFTQPQFARGQIDFASFSPNFLLGQVSNSNLGNGIADRRLRATDFNFFLQYDWRLSSNLTLNLGLRHELDLPPYDSRGRLATFDPALYTPRSTVAVPIGPPTGGFVQPSNVIPEYDLPNVPNVSDGIVDSVDPNNFAPRIGLAYSPAGSQWLVLRAGYGISYSRATFQTVSTAVTTPPYYLLARRPNPQSFSNPFAAIPTQDHFPTFVPPILLSGTVLDRTIRTPYFHQFNAGLQFHFKFGLLETAYVGAFGRELFRQVAINQAQLASNERPIMNSVTGEVITSNTPQNAQQRAPLQGVEINSFFQNQTTAESSYNSLQVSLTRRFSQKLELLTSYTFSKSIDNASGTGGGAGIIGIVNPGAVADTSMILGNQLDSHANRGVSDFDRTHRFVAAFLWNIPFLIDNSQSRVARAVFSDWQLSGIVIAMSGLPIDVVDTGAGSFYGLSNGSSALVRPQWATGANRGTATKNLPPGAFFNPAAFVRPIVRTGQTIPSSGGAARANANGTDIGNVGRNVLRGPLQRNIDFSVIKRFSFHEIRNLEFRAEFFNLFNHVNFANPISDLNSTPAGGIDSTTGEIISAGPFGRIISTSNNPRIIQFALKLNF